MDIEARIRQHIVENILFGDEHRCDADTPFQEGGILDSTGILEVITFVEEAFGIEVADHEVVPENLGTLRRLSAFVEKKYMQKDSVAAADALRSACLE